MPAPPTVVVLISGRGSNLRSLIAAQGPYRIAAVISDTHAPGLRFARDAGIETAIFPKEDFSDPEARRDALFAGVQSYAPAVVALAGFMQLVRPRHVQLFRGSMINIHPSLLPALPGLDTHRRALEGGEAVHGCTVHFVDEGMDTGPIIAQARVSIEPDDTEQTLAARVLEQEHLLYPWVVGAIARGDIALSAGSVVGRRDIAQNARERGFIFQGGTLS